MPDLIDVLHKNPLLQSLTSSTLTALLPEIKHVLLKPNEVLFNLGDSGDSFFIIESGMMKIMVKDLTLNRLSEGQSFGEMALLNNAPRSATAIAETEVRLIRISRVGFFKLIELQPALVEQFYDTFRKLMRQSLLMKAFARIFGELDTTLLVGLDTQFAWQTYAPGEVILVQGEIGDDALVIVTGRVRATFTNGESERVLGEVGSGSIIGEMALLSQAPRSATVTAIRETQVARMNRAVFASLMHDYPEFALRLMEIMVGRQQRNFDQNYIEKPTTLNIAVLATQPGVDTLVFAEALERHLMRHGSTLVLNRQHLEALYGLAGVMAQPHPTNQIVQLWIDTQEQNYDYVVNLVDEEWTPWTEWVLKSADRILLVGEASGSPALNDLEQAVQLQIAHQRYELVLLHEPTTARPSGTAKWLQPRSVFRHHHLRKGDEAHFARLARLLTGNGIGLVLSGGGARGYAHLGVIKALIDAGVPLDAIGSTSMGAVIGGSLLVYMDYHKILEKAETLGSRKAILDFTFPISALNRSKKISHIMAELYGDFEIEDGWLPFFCISTNITKATTKVHTHGKLADAVRASMSIPGVFTPVVREGDLHVDGGVMNNYPVDVMRQFLEGGKIIGSLVSGREGKRQPYTIEDHIDGWKLFLAGIVPGLKPQRAPSILKVILSATSVNSVQLIADFQRRTDLLLLTDAYPYGLLDFDKHAELALKGYEMHRESVEEWAKTNPHLIGSLPLGHTV